MIALNKYGNTFDGNIIPMYIEKYGENKPIGIEKMSYAVVRESAPIYATSYVNVTASSFSRGRRGVAGTFTIRTSELTCLADDIDASFEIHALVEEIGIEVRLEGVEITSMYAHPTKYMTECEFICRYIKMDDIPKPVQDVTNREMASKVLELS